MAENDIYNSMGRYQRIIQDIPNWVGQENKGRRKYWIYNPANKKYFEILEKKYQAQDLSYIRRVRMMRTLLMISYVVKKDFKDVTREDIDELLAYSHTVNRTMESKSMFASNLKTIWRNILPDPDEMGRPDETKTPYVVSHVKVKQDPSREKLPQDKMSKEEIQKIISYFADRPDLQCAMWLAYEGFARPQEILWRTVGDVELHDGYAKVWISGHGKEGVGFIRVIDGFEALTTWLRLHPDRENPQAVLFPGRKTNSINNPLRVESVNKFVRVRLCKLGVNKRVTLYSFKRNGITHTSQSGASDSSIMLRARWRSTKQIRRYNSTTQEDLFRLELEKRGLVETRERAGEPENNFVARDEKAFCTNCGSGLAVGTRFCGRCGQPASLNAFHEHRERVMSSVTDQNLIPDRIGGSFRL